MLYISIAIAPVIIILSYIYYRDKYNKEPIWLLLLLLFAGMFSVIPVLGVGSLTEYLAHHFGVKGLYKAGFEAFIQAGFVEEFFKYFFVFFLTWWSKYNDERFDGIIYAVFVSMGFALVENVMYVTGYGLYVGLVRTITAVPAHAIFAISMGYYLGMAKFSPKLRPLYLVLAFIVPWLLHGFYDFVLMADIPWLLIVFVVYMIFMYIFGFKRLNDLAKYKVKPVEPPADINYNLQYDNQNNMNVPPMGFDMDNTGGNNNQQSMNQPEHGFNSDSGNANQNQQQNYAAAPNQGFNTNNNQQSPPPLKNNLETIAIFHYVWGGLKIFASVFILIYLILGVGMIAGGTSSGDSEMQIIGGLFIVVSIIGFISVVFLGILSILCGKYLQQGKHRVFCMVMSGLACLNAPLGTVLGIFTIIELEKPHIKQIFERNKNK